MFSQTRNRIAVAMMIAPLTLAAGPASKTLEVMPQSRVWLSGTSTIRDFECEVTAFDLNVEGEPDNVAGRLLRGEKAVTGATLRVSTADLDCRNGTMNEHMLKALKADRNPAITFTMSSYDINGGTTGAQAALRGRLGIGGVTRDVVMYANAAPAGEGMVRVQGEYTVTMSQWDLSRPSLMLGTIKVGDEVVVHMNLVLKG